MSGTSLDEYRMQQLALSLWQQEHAGDNSAQLQRLRQKLARARATELTPRQQEILFLRYEQGMSSAQIARDLGVHRSTVSRTLHRAEARLRHCLEYSL